MHANNLLELHHNPVMVQIKKYTSFKLVTNISIRLNKIKVCASFFANKNKYFLM